MNPNLQIKFIQNSSFNHSKLKHGTKNKRSDSQRRRRG